MSSILVTDGEQRAALAVVRSLGRAGHRVYVCSAASHPLAGASRFASAEATVPDPLERPVDFIASLERLVGRWHIDMIMPVADPSLMAILPQRDHFKGVLIPYPPAATHHRVSDKARVLDVAAHIGIAVPGYQLLPDPRMPVDQPPPGGDFPVVVKPTRSIAAGEDGRIRFGVRYAFDSAELRARLAELPASAYPVLVQERIVGPAIGIFLLLWHGEALAVFAHNRLREKPPSGGVSVYRESVAPDQVLVARSQSLLDRFGWRGVAMVEYKIDAATGTPYLMEVNGRFWGSLQLAIDAGVDFPAILATAAENAPPPPRREYRTGVRSRWLWGDIDHLLIRLRGSRADLALPPGAPSRGRTALDFLKVWHPGNKCEVLRLHDLRPFLRESLNRLSRKPAEHAVIT